MVFNGVRISRVYLVAQSNPEEKQCRTQKDGLGVIDAGFMRLNDVKRLSQRCKVIIVVLG